MAEELHVALREQLGTRGCRQLRREGQIPAILYGHGKKNVNLSVPASELLAAIRHGSRLVEMKGAVSDSALIREVQWDPFGLEVLHLDLTRVSAEEAVEVVVKVELRGEAPGIREGGIIEHSTHEIEILCPAGAIPDKLEANINELHLDQEITAGDLHLPEGAKLLIPPETVVVQCVEPVVQEEEEEAAPVEAAEPEVIGRKEEEEESSEGS